MYVCFFERKREVERFRRMLPVAVALNDLVVCKEVLLLFAFLFVVLQTCVSLSQSAKRVLMHSCLFPRFVLDNLSAARRHLLPLYLAVHVVSRACVPVPVSVPLHVHVPVSVYLFLVCLCVEYFHQMH